jgi:hypothetical protein
MSKPNEKKRKLNEKRLDAALIILGAAGIGGFATFTPTPTVEVPKQVVLGFADITMCLMIWKTYFKEELSEKELLGMMGGAGLIALAAGGAGYVIAKGASGLLHEVLNAAILPGWIISGLVAASGTAVLGAAWVWFCDKKYQERPLLKA